MAKSSSLKYVLHDPQLPLHHSPQDTEFVFLVPSFEAPSRCQIPRAVRKPLPKTRTVGPVVFSMIPNTFAALFIAAKPTCRHVRILAEVLVCGDVPTGMPNLTGSGLVGSSKHPLMLVELCEGKTL